MFLVVSDHLNEIEAVHHEHLLVIVDQSNGIPMNDECLFLKIDARRYNLSTSSDSAERT